MVRDHSHRPGFRFTFRRLIILLVYFAVLFEVIVPLVEGAGSAKAANKVLPVLLLSPPLLAVLVVFIERAGPLKNWAVSFLLFLFFPALVLNHDFTILHNYLASGKPPTLWATVLVNAVILVNAPMYVRKMVPRRCPGCRRRTLVPLMRIFMKDKRTANTCWCASCGGKYWKDRTGTWRIERRKTWLDKADEPVTPKTEAAPGSRDPVPEMTHRPLGQCEASRTLTS
jgi:hypothetical protein